MHNDRQEYNYKACNKMVPFNDSEAHQRRTKSSNVIFFLVGD